MSVSSLEMSDAQTCLLERRYLTIKARLAQKYFWNLVGTNQRFTVGQSLFVSRPDNIWHRAAI
jgi:hypothetical protein